MKYRVEYAISHMGGPGGWEFYGNFATRPEAERVAHYLRRQFGRNRKDRFVRSRDDLERRRADLIQRFFGRLFIDGQRAGMVRNGLSSSPRTKLGSP